MTGNATRRQETYPRYPVFQVATVVPLVSVKSVDSCDDGVAGQGWTRYQVRQQVTCEQDTIMETGHRKDGTE